MSFGTVTRIVAIGISAGTFFVSTVYAASVGQAPQDNIEKMYPPVVTPKTFFPDLSQDEIRFIKMNTTYQKYDTIPSKFFGKYGSNACLTDYMVVSANGIEERSWEFNKTVLFLRGNPPKFPTVRTINGRLAQLNRYFKSFSFVLSKDNILALVRRGDGASVYSFDGQSMTLIGEKGIDGKTMSQPRLRFLRCPSNLAY